MARRSTGRYLDTSGGTVVANGEIDGSGSEGAHAPGSGDGNADNGGNVIDPGKLGGTSAGADGSDAGSGGDTRKRKPRSDRGRPRSARSPKEGNISLGGLKNVLLDTHMMLAGLCQAPGIAIDDSEAERLAATIGRVSRWYDIPEIGEKAMDHYALAVALATIYGTRLFAWINNGAVAKGAPGPGKPAPPRPVPQPQAPRGDGSLQLQDVNLGIIEVPPLPGAQPHSERRH